jgi:hypothetical protein
VGLSVCVGFLSDLKENDADGYANFAQYFDRINRVLAAHGLPSHKEPDDVRSSSASMYGYSSLHYLRRLAAYVDSGVVLPGPGNRNSSKDERMQAYYDDINRRPQNQSDFRREFDHLINHSDAEGFYLPQDFARVIVVGTENIPGGQVGSAPRLLAECDRLARVLQIPPHITEGSGDLHEAAASQGKGEALWQRYALESYACVVLQTACRLSIETGAAVVFT